VLPKCGHSVCKGCLNQIMKKTRPQCPLDYSYLSKDLRPLISTNFLAISLLEAKDQSSQCELHNASQNLICLNDATSVCSDCVIFGDHKGHDIMRISEFEEATKKKKAQLELILDKVSKNLPEIRSFVADKKKNMKKIVSEGFENIRKLINSYEVKLQSKLERILSEENMELCALKQRLLDLGSDVEVQLECFNDANFKYIAREDFADFEKFADEKLLLIKKQSEKFSELANLLQEAFSNKNLLNDIGIMTHLNDKLAKFDERLQTDVRLSEFLNLEKSQQRSILGDMIYPLIKSVGASLYAPKLTGMLIDLDELQIPEIVEFLKDEKVFKDKVDEALDLLNSEEL